MESGVKMLLNDLKEALDRGVKKDAPKKEEPKKEEPKKDEAKAAGYDPFAFEYL